MPSQFTQAKRGVIHCANCLHCKQFKESAAEARHRHHHSPSRLRVKCARGLWKLESGKPKTYQLSTVLSRRMIVCSEYESMGEASREEFLRDLAATLPDESEAE